MNLKSYIREIPDFPSQGILFKDITPLLKDASAMRAALDALTDLVGNQDIDIVVGMESRGFLFGPLLAQRFNAAFVPVRKPGKLPALTTSISYDLEYGSDTLEIHTDGIQKGQKVLVHDDILATGGTARATCELIERLGGDIVQCNFLIELGFLKGVERLDAFDVKSVMKY